MFYSVNTEREANTPPLRKNAETYVAPPLLQEGFDKAKKAGKKGAIIGLLPFPFPNNTLYISLLTNPSIL